jgi:nucleoside-diphosphate-sugar epimerase
MYKIESIIAVQLSTLDSESHQRNSTISGSKAIKTKHRCRLNQPDNSSQYRLTPKSKFTNNRAMSKRILLTGANGFIAQHVLSQLLEAGHSVRAVVRSQEKVTQLTSTFFSFTSSSRLDFGVVNDITAPKAFDGVLVSNPPFDVVAHTASPFNYRTAESNSDFLEPAVKGTTEILEGIARVAPSVKRVLLTGSMAAIINFGAEKVTKPVKVYSEKDWNPTEWEQALTTKNMSTVYQASKKYAEKAGWDFVATRKPNFDLVVLNPPMVYGPVFDADSIPQPKDLNQSTWGIYNNFLGAGKTSASEVPPTGLHLYVDVRDIALAHRLAIETPAAGGHRFVVAGGAVSNQRIANILREKLPELRERIPLGKPEEAGLPEGSFEADASLVKETIGLTFRSVEETIGDLAVQLAEIDQRRID